MGGIKLSVHPLFFLFGLYYALTGRIFIFVIYTLSAVAHEIGHSFSAERRGYKLNKITLMPFGAVCQGDVEGLNFSDQSAIALAGPLTNLLIGVVFVASWWVFPETYAFTDVVAEANFSLAMINFLPVYPLDGGRVLQSAIALKYNGDKARRVCRITGIIFASLLFILFLYSLSFTFNLSLLFFSLFLLFGAFNDKRENRYIKLFSNKYKSHLKRGTAVKEWAIDKEVTVGKFLSILDLDCLNEVTIFDDGKKVLRISQDKIMEIAEKGDIYSPLSRYI